MNKKYLMCCMRQASGPPGPWQNYRRRELPWPKIYPRCIRKAQEAHRPRSEADQRRWFHQCLLCDICNNRWPLTTGEVGNRAPRLGIYVAEAAPHIARAVQMEISGFPHGDMATGWCWPRRLSSPGNLCLLTNICPNS
jgi:hypothetical protein